MVKEKHNTNKYLKTIVIKKYKLKGKKYQKASDH